MAAYVILGSATPAAAATATLATGTANGTVVGSFSVCNKGGSTDAIRVSITKSGGSAYYVYYGFNLTANSSIRENPGWTLALGDIVSVYSTTGNTDFIATGSNL